jgi:hypothetical protein
MESGTQRLNFTVGQRPKVRSRSYHAKNPRHLQDPCSLYNIDFYKEIGGEERYLDSLFAPVLPAVLALVERKKAFHVAILNMIAYPLFVPR